MHEKYEGRGPQESASRWPEEVTFLWRYGRNHQADPANKLGNHEVSEDKP